MATQAKVIITGQNDIGSAVRSASKDLSSLKDSASKLENALKTTFSVTAILATVKKLGDGVVACFSDFSSAERSYKQLALAIGNTEAFSRLVTCIDNLSRQTLSSKDDIKSMVSELAALGKSADEIEKITSASVYLSNVTGKDLRASMSIHKRWPRKIPPSILSTSRTPGETSSRPSGVSSIITSAPGSQTRYRLFHRQNRCDKHHQLHRCGHGEFP